MTPWVEGTLDGCLVHRFSTKLASGCWERAGVLRVNSLCCCSLAPCVGGLLGFARCHETPTIKDSEQQLHQLHLTWLLPYAARHQHEQGIQKPYGAGAGWMGLAEHAGRT